MKTRTDPSSKPYYRCLSCPRFGKTCAGKPTRDLPTKEWCEFIRDVKEVRRISNAYIAKEADVSIKRVESIIALDVDQDIKRETARRIELAVIGTSNHSPCYLDYDDATLLEKIAELEHKLKYWREENERKAKVIDKLIG